MHPDWHAARGKDCKVSTGEGIEGEGSRATGSDRESATANDQTTDFGPAQPRLVDAGVPGPDVFQNRSAVSRRRAFQASTYARSQVGQFGFPRVPPPGHQPATIGRRTIAALRSATTAARFTRHTGATGRRFSRSTSSESVPPGRAHTAAFRASGSFAVRFGWFVLGRGVLAASPCNEPGRRCPA